MALVIFLPDIYFKLFQINKSLDYSIEERMIIMVNEDKQNDREDFKIKNSLVPFDPNSVEKSQMLTLGFPTFLTERIIKYRNAGGKFRRKKDLLKIYGMDESFYSRLESFILIPKNEVKQISEKSTEEPEKEERLMLNLNLCDSSELIRLKGIGPVFASRIIRYRKVLGGYVSLRQLTEVYGLTDSTFNVILPNLYIDIKDSVDKIAINNTDVVQLRKHPYFRNYNLCNSIVNFRLQHGNYNSIDDLKLIALVTDSTLEKIRPYVTFDR